MRRQVQHIHSRENALLKDLRRLAQDSTAYRKQGRVWLEGEHLCRAAMQKDVKPELAVFAEGLWTSDAGTWEGAAERSVVVPDELFRAISGLESPAHVGFVIDLPEPEGLDARTPTVVLDSVQDAGNVGAVLRSAAAFGFRQVAALKGSAALWSPKVLRAGMGAHFGLRLVEGIDAHALDALELPLLATSSHQGDLLHRARLPWPCAWVFGHEGQGVSRDVSMRAAQWVRIVQPGGEESLNVAAAAAICLHASASAAYGL